MTGRDPMKGRHSVGTQRVNTGKTRGGQSEPAGNKTKTAGSYSITPKAPVLNDAKETSLDLQKRISGRAQQPFTNKGGAATLPTPASPRGSKPGPVEKPYAGLSGNTVGQSNPSGGAVGYSKLPNQSYQIGGRTSVARSPRRAGSNASGYPSKRNASFYGE
jgi:hypothetical protein